VGFSGSTQKDKRSSLEPRHVVMGNDQEAMVFVSDSWAFSQVLLSLIHDSPAFTNPCQGCTSWKELSRFILLTHYSWLRCCTHRQSGDLRRSHTWLPTISAWSVPLSLMSLYLMFQVWIRALLTILKHGHSRRCWGLFWRGLFLKHQPESLESGSRLDIDSYLNILHHGWMKLCKTGESSLQAYRCLFCNPFN
jgi:hypothetical protein